MSSLETRRILGSSGRLSWISRGFAWLVRFDDGVANGVTCMGDESRSEGIKTRFNALPPVGKILNSVRVWMIGPNGDTVLAGLSSLEFEGVDGSSVEIVGDSSDVFELIGHIVSFMMGRSVQFLINSRNRCPDDQQYSEDRLCLRLVLHRLVPNRLLDVLLRNVLNRLLIIRRLVVLIRPVLRPLLDVLIRPVRIRRLVVLRPLLVVLIRLLIEFNRLRRMFLRLMFL